MSPDCQRLALREVRRMISIIDSTVEAKVFFSRPRIPRRVRVTDTTKPRAHQRVRQRESIPREPISLEQVLKEPQAKGVPLTGEEIAEAELQAAWEETTNVIPLRPRPRPIELIQPLGKPSSWSCSRSSCNVEQRCLEFLHILAYNWGQGVGPRGRPPPRERLQWLLEPTTKSAS